MFSAVAYILGYLLNILYSLINNYGIAIILFSIIIKLIMMPISIKQQKTLKKTTELQEKMKVLQVKYKNNPEELQRETMELYKTENVNPFGGCFSAIMQIILLFAVFYLVKSPLTYMKKVEPELIEKYRTEISENSNSKDAYPEISIIREKSAEDDRVYINMDFFGIDLSSIPQRDYQNWKTYVIPALYVITSFISMLIATSMQKKLEKEKPVKKEEGEEEEDFDVMAQTNKNMTYMMPLIALSISAIAPLGLALYWLINNILMIIERLVMNKFFGDKEEKVNA